MVIDIITRYGQIDILANTAGVFDGFVKSLDTSIELWDKLPTVLRH